MQCREFYSLDK